MKREQKILYGLLALVIFFIIWKFIFKKNENFALGSVATPLEICQERDSDSFFSRCHNTSGATCMMGYESNKVGAIKKCYPSRMVQTLTDKKMLSLFQGSDADGW